jgi:hypothetical protein
VSEKDENPGWKPATIDTPCTLGNAGGTHGRHYAETLVIIRIGNAFG